MTTHKLYDGSVDLEFNEAKHFYSVQGEGLEQLHGRVSIPSVTGITGIVDKSGPLMWWAVSQCIEYVKDPQNRVDSSDEVAVEQYWHDAHRAHQRVSRTAATIGSMAHDWIHQYLGGKTPKFPKNEKLRQTIRSFLKWHTDHELEPYETEFKVYSKEHRFAGTCDFDGLVNGRRCILDWKTSKAIYPDMALQVMAYQIAREEELDMKYDARWIVCLPRDGGEVVAERYGQDTEDTHRAGFLGALALHRAIKKK